MLAWKPTEESKPGTARRCDRAVGTYSLSIIAQGLERDERTKPN
jgi:hypothetical protein